ncbi:MAG TPA: lycopene cyclase family protein, partial [Flavobacterium sp.]
LKHKTILIVDRSVKQENDRTWCFWEKGEGKFEPVVHKQWNQLEVGNSRITKHLDILPYNYKIIRGIDYYRFCLELLQNKSNVTFIVGEIESIFSDEQTGIIVSGAKITSKYVFNSTFQKPTLKPTEYWMLQHFKGWYIKTDSPVFNPEKATLMDFNTPQQEGTTFFYVLPFSPTEALVEYTVFSNGLLDDRIYDNALREYITTKLRIDKYQIEHEEFGVIPMTNYGFSSGNNNIINIGTAGGMTKGSSGYTFQNIQKHSQSIIHQLVKGGDPKHNSVISARHRFYDSVLLNILHNKTLSGDEVFMQLFRKNPPTKILKFLDNETSIAEDISIISSLPTLPFAKAAFRQLFT